MMWYDTAVQHPNQRPSLTSTLRRTQSSGTSSGIGEVVNSKPGASISLDERGTVHCRLVILPQVLWGYMYRLPIGPVLPAVLRREGWASGPARRVCMHRARSARIHPIISLRLLRIVMHPMHRNPFLLGIGQSGDGIRLTSRRTSRHRAARPVFHTLHIIGSPSI